MSRATLGDWTQPHKPENRTAARHLDTLYASLRDLADRNRLVVFSVDNPGLHFSNRGQLKRVSGTDVYARDARPPTAK